MLCFSLSLCPCCFSVFCQGALFGALTGGSGVKIEIRLTPTAQQQHPQQQLQYGQQQLPPQQYPQPLASAGVIPIDHYPSWRLHKNPFWRVKSPQLSKMASVTPTGMGPGGEMDTKQTQLYGYEASQDISGIVTLQIPPGKKVEHLGIKVQFIGRIDMVRFEFKAVPEVNRHL
jgi:Vacuolar protein sorting-associated protein 26